MDDEQHADQPRVLEDGNRDRSQGTERRRSARATRSVESGCGADQHEDEVAGRDVQAAEMTARDILISGIDTPRSTAASTGDANTTRPATRPTAATTSSRRGTGGYATTAADPQRRPPRPRAASTSRAGAAAAIANRLARSRTDQSSACDAMLTIGAPHRPATADGVGRMQSPQCRHRTDEPPAIRATATVAVSPLRRASTSPRKSPSEDSRDVVRDDAEHVGVGYARHDLAQPLGRVSAS